MCPPRMHRHAPRHAMIFAQLCLLSLRFPAPPDEPVEGRIQSSLQGEMSQFRLLAGVPQHLWLEVPLSALPRGKETGGLCVLSSGQLLHYHLQGKAPLRS